MKLFSFFASDGEVTASLSSLLIVKPLRPGKQTCGKSRSALERRRPRRLFNEAEIFDKLLNQPADAPVDQAYGRLVREALRCVLLGRPVESSLKQFYRVLRDPYLTRVIERLCSLTDRFNVIQPVAPYRVNAGQVTVRGHYGVLSSEMDPKALYVLRIHPHEFASDARADLISCARVLHLGYVSQPDRKIKVLHFPLEQDRHWVEVLSQQQARRAIEQLPFLMLSKPPQAA